MVIYRARVSDSGDSTTINCMQGRRVHTGNTVGSDGKPGRSGRYRFIRGLCGYAFIADYIEKRWTEILENGLRYRHNGDLVIIDARDGEAKHRAFDPEGDGSLGAKQVNGLDLNGVGQRHGDGLRAQAVG